MEPNAGSVARARREVEYDEIIESIVTAIQLSKCDSNADQNGIQSWISEFKIKYERARAHKLEEFITPALAAHLL